MTPAIVSAADAAYGRSLAQLLLSVARHHDVARVRTIVYDLGLAPSQRDELAARCGFAEVRAFDFTPYPEFVRLRPRAINTNAWKPQVIAPVLADAPGPVLWLDSATVVLAPLDPVFAAIAAAGVYAAFGGRSTIGELTHPAALDALGATAVMRARRQRGSGVVGFDPRHPGARELAQAWARACLDERCVAPPGATLANHRFDQSVLNVLLAQRPGLAPGDDELDISSARPSRHFRVRNKVSPRVPLALDPVVRAAFAVRRAVDVAAWRLRLGRRAADRASAPVARRA